MDISHTFCRSATKFGSVSGLANRNLFPDFRELQSVTDALVEWFVDKYPIFADSFSVLSAHSFRGR